MRQAALTQSGMLLPTAYGVASIVLASLSAALAGPGSEDVSTTAVCLPQVRTALLSIAMSLAEATKEFHSGAFDASMKAKDRKVVENRLTEFCHVVLKVCISIKHMYCYALMSGVL